MEWERWIRTRQKVPRVQLEKEPTAATTYEDVLDYSSDVIQALQSHQCWKDSCSKTASGNQGCRFAMPRASVATTRPTQLFWGEAVDDQDRRPLMHCDPTEPDRRTGLKPFNSPFCYEDTRSIAWEVKRPLLEDGRMVSTNRALATLWHAIPTSS